MALPEGLTAAEQADYLATLRGPYVQHTRVEVLTNERDLITTLRASVIGGQVDGLRVALDPLHTGKEDQSIPVSRMLKGLALYDPSRSIALDSNSPTDGALGLDRCVRVIVSIRGSLRWYDIPVFTGSISSLDRDGVVVSVDAEGCESFGLGAAYKPGTLKGRKVEVFRELMYRSGEVDAWMDLPTSTEKLADDVVLSRDTRYWDKAFPIMASMNRLCEYDGMGRLRTPEISEVPVIDLDYGDDGLLLDYPTSSKSRDNFRNSWWEQTNSKKGKDVNVTVALPDSHALSPINMGRNGKPLYLMGNESNSDLRTKKKATKRGQTNLDHAGLEIPVRGIARPVWHLSPSDWVRVSVPELSIAVPVNEFSLPLAGGPMTFGYSTRLPNTGWVTKLIAKAA